MFGAHWTKGLRFDAKRGLKGLHRSAEKTRKPFGGNVDRKGQSSRNGHTSGSERSGKKRRRGKDPRSKRHRDKLLSVKKNTTVAGLKH